MRSAIPWFVLASSLAFFPACVDKDKTPEWQKPPKSYDPKTAELTFNAANMDKFNALNAEQRQAYIDELKAKPGSFVGQAIFKSGAGLGSAMDDAIHGSWEGFAVVPEPVLYEITYDYRLFTTPELGKSLPANGAIEFRGTLIDLTYQADAKPRKMALKVKVDEAKALQD